MKEQPTEEKTSSYKRREPLIFLLPNILTTANLFCGFFSILSAIRGDWANSATGIILAAFTDGLDGRVARMTKTESAFGEQYDSMSDLVSFGAAPAVLMFSWALWSYGRLGWLVTFLYLTCAALRLARFNVLKQSTEKRYFQGLPSPVAACGVASAVLFYQGWTPGIGWRGIYMLVVMFTLASTMISTLRYRSFKDLNFRSQRGFGYLLMVIATMVVVSSMPEKVLFPIIAVYVCSGIFAESARFIRRRVKWFPGKGRS